MDSKQTLTKKDTENRQKKMDNIPKSRFSRRRFLRTTAITSPILLSVKSPVAWGSSYNTSHDSLTLHLSANASNVGAVCNPRPPKYWFDCFCGLNQFIENILNDNGCSANQELFNLCSVEHLKSWQQNRSISRQWKFKLVTKNSPTLREALEGNKKELIVKFKRDVNNKREIKAVNIIKDIPKCYPNMVCAILNSLFHPTPINYYDINEVKRLIVQAIENAINDALMDVEYPTALSSNSNPISNLIGLLDQWSYN